MMRATAWGAGAALVALLLGGCADLSGEVDDAGHNGYDKQTCTDFKSFAMDAEHQVITGDVAMSRARTLLAGTAKNSDQAIRDGVATYLQAWTSGDTDAAERASTALLKVCQF